MPKSIDRLSLMALQIKRLKPILRTT